MIPFSEVISRIRKLADEHPDRVVGCDYFNEDGTPCCIVGNVISELGGVRYGSSAVNAAGEKIVYEGTRSDLVHWKLLGVESPSNTERDWVYSVQKEQDNESTWRQAVDAVDSR